MTPRRNLQLMVLSSVLILFYSTSFLLCAGEPKVIKIANERKAEDYFKPRTVEEIGMKSNMIEYESQI